MPLRCEVRRPYKAQRCCAWHRGSCAVLTRNASRAGEHRVTKRDTQATFALDLEACERVGSRGICTQVRCATSENFVVT